LQRLIVDDETDALPARRGGPPARAALPVPVAGHPAVRSGPPARRGLPALPEPMRPAHGPWDTALAVIVALAVAVAFADSSIVVLALPEIYVDFGTSIPGVSWVITAYNFVVAVAAFALLPLTRRVRPALLAAVGITIFLAASIGCGVAGDLTPLIVFRCVQGLGAALLLAASLPLLVALTGSVPRGRRWWALAGALGAAFGPALGGLLTEMFDWRAIFIAQAPIAAAALVAGFSPAVRRLAVERERPRFEARRLWANLGLLCVFGALVGALFLAVLMIVTVWSFGPLAGAAVVSALPVAALLVRPLSGLLTGVVDVAAGALLLAAGLVALAFLPDTSAVYAGLALGICGAGFGLAVPPLTRDSVIGDTGLAGHGTVSVGARHVGLVLALVLIAPLLAYELERGGERATLNATAVILDARLPLEQKVPIALDLRDEFERTPDGKVPDLAAPFADNGAAEDAAVAKTRDDLLGTIEAALTRSFRTSYLLAAIFALLALVPLALARLRREA
jgi:MFS family permease